MIYRDRYKGLWKMIDDIMNTFFALDRETPGDEDADYKKLYFGLFNGISLVIENTRTHKQAVEALKQLQCMAEDFYVGGNSGE